VNAGGLKTAIERALMVAPRGFERLTAPAQAGVRVLDVRVERRSASAQRITIDLSQKTLTYDASGDVELVLDQVIRSTAPLTAGAGNVEYRFLIDGLPLDMFQELPRGPLRSAARPATAPGAPLNANRRVLLSAGHGWYWNEKFGAWHLQRDHFWGIVEDVVNWELASELQTALRPTRFDARLARNPDRLARPGPSGHPGWQEGAVYFIKGLGAPADVWNVGASDYARDINSRPLYANLIEMKCSTRMSSTRFAASTMPTGPIAGCVRATVARARTGWRRGRRSSSRSPSWIRRVRTTTLCTIRSSGRSLRTQSATACTPGQGCSRRKTTRRCRVYPSMIDDR
jgi:hypothetical protein